MDFREASLINKVYSSSYPEHQLLINEKARNFVKRINKIEISKKKI